MKKIKVVKEHRKRALELIDMAEQIVKEGDIELARRYVRLALTYSSKFRFKLPLIYKRKICRKCFVPLIPGLTERRRIKNKVIVRTCIYCGWVRRYPVKKTDKGS